MNFHLRKKKRVYIKNILLTVAIISVSTGCTKNPGPDISEKDKTFMVQASYDDLNTIEFAKLALVKSSDTSLKDFSATLIADHSVNLKEISDSLADQFGFRSSLPVSVDSAHSELMATISMLSGYDFDTAFINRQIVDHNEELSLYQSETSSGYNWVVMDFASRRLPQLQGHLETAKEIAKSLHP